VRHLLLAPLAALASQASAGGLDLSGQPVTLLFRDGGHAEATLGTTSPRVIGTDAGGASSGDVFETVGDLGLGVVRRFGSAWSGALILDRPYGVRVDYDAADTAFPFAGTHAEPESLALTALLRYDVDARWSVHGGLRAERFGGEAFLDGWGYGPLAGYAWEGDPDWGLGFVVGGAFEIPEIALRVALTYGSEIAHELDATETGFGPSPLPSTTPVTMPQSVNLDFQTGVAPRTLLYGLVRWVNWDGWQVAPAGLLAATGQPLIEFDSDAFTYRLGLARQLGDALAAAIEVTHETARNETTTPLDPYDGFTTLGVGGRYTTSAGVTLGAGLGYTWLGDATAAIPGGPSASFAGNHAVSARLSIGIGF
jgi:long-chain fatty acid transport protein